MPTGIHNNHRGGRPRRIYADQKQRAELGDLLCQAIQTVKQAMIKKANSTQLAAAEVIIDRFFPKLKHMEIATDPDNPIHLLTHAELIHAIINIAEESKKQLPFGNHALPDPLNNSNLTSMQKE